MKGLMSVTKQPENGKLKCTKLLRVANRDLVCQLCRCHNADDVADAKLAKQQIQSWSTVGHSSLMSMSELAWWLPTAST